MLDKENKARLKAITDLAREMVSSNFDDVEVDPLESDDISDSEDGVWVRCWFLLRHDDIENAGISLKPARYRVRLIMDEYDEVYDSYSICDWFEHGGEVVVGSFENRGPAELFIADVQAAAEKLPRENQLICEGEIEQND